MGNADFIAKIRAERSRLIFQLKLINDLLRVYEQTSGVRLPKSRDPRSVLLDEDFDEMDEVMFCRDRHDYKGTFANEESVDG